MASKRSFIFSFDCLSLEGARVPKALVLAVLAVGSAELALHALEDRLPDPVLWGGGEVSTKVAQVEAWEGESVDVLLLGPSHASIGLTPAAMRKEQGFSDLSVYNGGLNGRTFTVIDFVSRHVYEPEFRPKVAVVTASPVVLNGNNMWMERNSSEFFTAPIPAALSSRGVRKRWGLFLTKHVNLYKYRRRGEGLAKGFVGGKKVLDRFGYHAVEGEYDFDRRRELAAAVHPYQSIMSSHSFDGVSVDAFRVLIQRLRDRGTEVVVVNMPFRQELLEISVRGAEEYDDYLKAVENSTIEVGAYWWDYQNGLELTDMDFRDVDHLNVTGAEKVSRRLAQDLLREFPSLLAKKRQ